MLHLHSLLELEELHGENKTRIIQASKNISKYGIKTIITTLGKNGCLIYEATEEKITEIPAFKVQAVDTVGAGDCFNGVIASKLCQGENIITSAIYATAAASIAITRQGAQASMPYKSEIEDRFKQYNTNYKVRTLLYERRNS